MSDNWSFSVRAEGAKTLGHVLHVAFGNKSKATHYEVKSYKDSPTLILFWAVHEKATVLPFTLDANSALAFVQAWLAEQDYGPQPDHDGDNGKGWHVFNEAWTHVDGRWQAFVAIQPAWMLYGK